MSRGNRWTPEMEAQLRERWSAGEKAKDIAAALGVPRNSVLGKAHRMKLSKRAAGGFGKHQTERGQDEEILSQLRRYARGMSLKKIARQDGVTEACVRRRISRVCNDDMAHSPDETVETHYRQGAWQ